MKTVITLLSSLLITFSAGNAWAMEGDPQLFHSESGAKQHCHGDTVVWVNTKTEVYHFPGEHWYGRTKQGAYVCKADADDAGFHPTGNGQ